MVGCCGSEGGVGGAGSIPVVYILLSWLPHVPACLLNLNQTSSPCNAPCIVTQRCCACLSAPIPAGNQLAVHRPLQLDERMVALAAAISIDYGV